VTPPMQSVRRSRPSLEVRADFVAIEDTTHVAENEAASKRSHKTLVGGDIARRTRKSVVPPASTAVLRQADEN
jgi:hypothetical protein